MKKTLFVEPSSPLKKPFSVLHKTNDAIERWKVNQEPYHLKQKENKF